MSTPRLAARTMFLVRLGGDLYHVRWDGIRSETLLVRVTHD